MLIFWYTLLHSLFLAINNQILRSWKKQELLVKGDKESVR
jgi:hypothetical protein